MVTEPRAPGENAVEDEPVVEMAEMFGTIARELMHQPDIPSTLQRIVDLAVEHLEGCESAGLTVTAGKSITSPASSGGLAVRLDRIQEDVGEGPCLDALRHQAIYRTGSLDRETRWPAFSRRARAETGVVSILAIRLFVGQNTMGALNLYSTRRDAFDDLAVALATVFATHASIAATSSYRDAQLQDKALTRDLIGRAKGILIGQRHITDEEAFDLLRAASQRLNIKVTDVAEKVMYTGELPR